MRILLIVSLLLTVGAAEEPSDRLRPVTSVTTDSFALQYFTAEPCPTRVQIREAGGEFRAIDGSDSNSTYHRITVTGLKPGTRYFYRVFDPAHGPDETERHWGAEAPWRREFAISTRSEPGKLTVIHLPIKVLLMPNVLNLASAHDETGALAALPAKMSAEDLDRIRNEYAIASRYFFINSGLRLWVDFQIYVDDRWQRWGDEPPNVADDFKGWPVCRSYSGQDFDPPGGGMWTVLDTSDPTRATTQPVHEEIPFAGQVEQAFARKWDPKKSAWVFYTSGGGTYGVDELWRGIPARSQFLGGGDTAWLAAHEVHHQLESFGAFSLGNREDDRIVYNHPATRAIRVGKGGKLERTDWSSTLPRQGEHWNVMAMSDRSLTDAQWLRFYFGQTITVADADNDGVPDDDPRLPIDEKRFGSDATRDKTDGAMSDRDKLMLSIWAPAPLQPTWNKPAWQSAKIDPTNPDTDGDGLPDTIDPYPVYPWAPFVWPMTAKLDGEANEWKDIPISGEMNRGAMHLVFKQSHDEGAYYGLITIGGPWRKVELTMDGEGEGAFSGVGVYHLRLERDEETGEVKMSAPRKTEHPSLSWKAGRDLHGNDVIEFSLPNGRSPHDWHWRKGGREIGVSIEATADDGKIYTVYEPYVLFYARMLE